MATQAVAQRGISIRQACCAFSVSETCYRYEPKMANENARIADWLIRLTQQHSDWGLGIWFMLCLFAQYEAVLLESQTRLPDLLRTSVKPSDKTT